MVFMFHFLCYCESQTKVRCWGSSERSRLKTEKHWKMRHKRGKGGKNCRMEMLERIKADTAAGCVSVHASLSPSVCVRARIHICLSAPASISTEYLCARARARVSTRIFLCASARRAEL